MTTACVNTWRWPPEKSEHQALTLIPAIRDSLPFSNLKGWARGVYHGLRRKHLQAYLDEFVLRFNRRKTRHAAFRSLFRLATNAEPLTYSMLIEPEPCA